MKLSQLVAQEDFIQRMDEELLKLMEFDFQYTEVKYAGCSYTGPAMLDYCQVGPDCKGCIFGTALQNLGWDPSEKIPEGAYIKGLIDWAGGAAPGRWTNIQNAQDKGANWKDLKGYMHDVVQEPT